MSAGTFTDTTVQPKIVYWYKVLGIDQTGNISEIVSAVPVSTFAFTTAGPAAPTITSVAPSASPCYVLVTWSPAFNAALHAGFMVLRAPAAAGPFVQAGTLVTAANTYTDAYVQRGATYWYKVVVIDVRGVPSAASSAVQATVP
jgi:chitodextrinase